MLTKLVGAIGLLGLIAFGAATIESLIRKQPRKPFYIGIIASILFIFLSGMLYIHDEKVQNADLESRFGDVSLTDDQVSALADQLTSDPVNTSLSNNIKVTDKELLSIVRNTFSEININDDLAFSIIKDFTSSTVRTVNLKTTYFGKEMIIGLFQVDNNGKWIPVDIRDYNNNHCYWSAKDVKKYYDIYDWKTDRIISSKSE